MRPDVSVVVTAHRERAFVRRAMGTVLAQRGVDLELVVVDDHSVDGTASEIARLADGQRVRAVRHERNLGLAAARNTGLGTATGRWVTFLDADDHLFPGSLAARLAALAGPASDVAGAYCDWWSVGERSRWLRAPRRPSTRPDVSLLSAEHAVPFIASAPMLDREILTALGGFDETSTTAEDAELWSWWLRLAAVIRYAPHVGVAYRRRRRSMRADDLLGHAIANRSAMARLDGELVGDGDLPLLRHSEGVYREQQAALGRHLLALAGEVEAGAADAGHSALEGFDPWLLRLRDPARLADQAVRALAARRPGGRRLRRKDAALVRRVRSVIDRAAAPRPSRDELLQAASELRVRRPGRLIAPDGSARY